MESIFESREPCSEILILLYASVKAGNNATLNFHTSSWDTWHPLFSDHTIFHLHVCIVNHFRNKILSSQRNVDIIQILGRIPSKKGLFRGDFSFVRRKRHARVKPVFFQINSWCWKTYHI